MKYTTNSLDLLNTKQLMIFAFYLFYQSLWFLPIQKIKKIKSQSFWSTIYCPRSQSEFSIPFFPKFNKRIINHIYFYDNIFILWVNSKTCTLKKIFYYKKKLYTISEYQKNCWSENNLDKDFKEYFPKNIKNNYTYLPVIHKIQPEELYLQSHECKVRTELYSLIKQIINI